MNRTSHFAILRPNFDNPTGKSQRLLFGCWPHFSIPVPKSDAKTLPEVIHAAAADGQ